MAFSISEDLILPATVKSPALAYDCIMGSISLERNSKQNYFKDIVCLEISNYHWTSKLSILLVLGDLNFFWFFSENRNKVFLRKDCHCKYLPCKELWRPVHHMPQSMQYIFRHIAPRFVAHHLCLDQWLHQVTTLRLYRLPRIVLNTSELFHSSGGSSILQGSHASPACQEIGTVDWDCRRTYRWCAGARHRRCGNLVICQTLSVTGLIGGNDHIQYVRYTCRPTFNRHEQHIWV